MAQRKKEVLYLSYDGLTDPLGQSQILPYLKGLSRLGYRFTILSFEKPGNFKQLKSLIYDECNKNYIRWKPLIFHSNPPFIAKAYDRAIFKKKAIELHGKYKFNLLHCRSYIASEIGLYFKENFNVPFLFDMRGLWADEKVDGGNWRLTNPIYRSIYNHYKGLEKKFVEESGHIISLTHAGKTEIARLYGEALKINDQSMDIKCTVIPTCADLALFDYNLVSQQERELLKTKLNIPTDSVILSYSGSLGTWYMIDEMLDLFKVFKKKFPGSIFLILTKDQDIIRQKIKEGGVSEHDLRVVFAQKKELPLYLSLSDCSVFFIKNSYSKISSSPTKHAELMGMGIPVICNELGDTGYFLNNYRIGLKAAVGNKASYEEATAAFELNSFSKEEIRQCALDNFDLEKGILSYETVYDKIFTPLCWPNNFKLGVSLLDQ